MLADFDPFGALSLFDEMWPSHFEAEERQYVPAMDVSETDTEYRIRLEVPGMEKDDIKIEYENNVLTLSGEKKTSVEKKDEKVYRMERRYGAFTRSLRFKDIDSDKITASYKNGVLEITAPKTEVSKPKRIDIK